MNDNINDFVEKYEDLNKRVSEQTEEKNFRFLIKDSGNIIRIKYYFIHSIQ